MERLPSATDGLARSFQSDRRLTGDSSFERVPALMALISGLWSVWHRVNPAIYILLGKGVRTIGSRFRREVGWPTSDYWPVFLELKPLKLSGDLNLKKSELEPDEFPFARLSRPRLVDRVPLGWALVLVLLAFTLVASGKYLLEPTSL
jgi:hypothetical protein